MTNDSAPHPRSLQEVDTEDAALVWFNDMTREFALPFITRIKHGAVTEDERTGSPKVDSACKAWNRYLEFTHGVIDSGRDSVVHMPA